MCTAHCRCYANNCWTWALCMRSDGRTSPFTIGRRPRHPLPIGPQGWMGWPGRSRQGVQSMAMMTGDFWGGFGNHG